jgi:predicted alpha/beta-fold hydrolase
MSYKSYHEMITVPMNGYADIYDYLKKCSPYFRIPSIKQPTLFMNSLNDPFMGEVCLDYEVFKLNPNAILATNKYGGHMGYHESTLGMKQWHSKPAIDFIEALRQNFK